MRSLIQSVIILIAVLMSTTGAEEKIYIQVGQSVTLNPPGGADPNKYMYWYFGEAQIGWRNKHGGHGFIEGWKDSLSWSGDSLIIKNIQPKHFGKFSGSRNPQVSSSFCSFSLFRLNVMVPPSPLLPGESLTLTCKTISPYRTEIHWLDPKGLQTDNPVRLPVKSSQHNGQWTCVVTHDKKETKAVVSVTVVDLSPGPSGPQYTSESTRLSIPCSITPHISWEQIKNKSLEEVRWDFFRSPGSNPGVQLFSLSLADPPAWKKVQDKGLSTVDLNKGNLSLTRKQGREDDSGDYVCTLKFKDVTLNKTVHVNVLQIISKPGKDLISGQQLNLTCSFGRPLPPDLKVKWIPPQQSSLLTLTSDHHPAHLIIPEVGTEDSGKWRCELWQNSTWLTSAVITLKIEPKLSVWMLVIICSVTVIVILILVLVFIYCRRRQQKMRHLRHRLCRCKNPKPKGFYRT